MKTKLHGKTNMTAFVTWKGEDAEGEDNGYCHSFYCFGRSEDGKQVLLQARECYNGAGEWSPHPIQDAGWQKLDEMESIEINRREMFKADEKLTVAALPVVTFEDK